MAESRKNVINEFKAKWLARFLNNYLVFKSWLALTFLVFAFGFFTFILKTTGDFGKILLVLYGVIMLFLCLALIIEYVLKSTALQRTSGIKTYSTIFSVNTVFGLILPLIYANIILAVIVRSMALMTCYGTFLCKVRISLVNFYYNNQIYPQINTIIFWIIIFTVAMFVFGGLLERIFSKK